MFLIINLKVSAFIFIFVDHFILIFESSNAVLGEAFTPLPNPKKINLKNQQQAKASYKSTFSAFGSYLYT
jgi:hypothetical protein